jgi:hypothetical protein
VQIRQGAERTWRPQRMGDSRRFAHLGSFLAVIAISSHGAAPAGHPAGGPAGPIKKPKSLRFVLVPPMGSADHQPKDPDDPVAQPPPRLDLGQCCVGFSEQSHDDACTCRGSGADRRATPVWKLDSRFHPARQHEAWEAEALGQSRIVRLVRNALDGLLPEPLDDVLEREAEQRVRVAGLLDGLDE